MLSSELVDLLHHVELSDAGWHDKAIDQLVLSVFLTAGTASSPASVAVKLASALPAAAASVSRSVQRLLQARQLVAISTDSYAVAEGVRRSAEERRRAAEVAEVHARSEWERTLAINGVFDLSHCDWAWFSSAVLEPLIQTQGARTYELLATAGGAGKAKDGVQPRVDELDPDLRAPVLAAIEDFLLTRELTVRDYILRRLHAHLLSLAAGLSQASVETLRRRISGTVNLSLFVDTNVVFSILGLHENPANEAVRDLLALLHEVKAHVAVKLYVSPLTVDEAKRTLSVYKDQLNRIAITPKLGAAALALDGQVSGIALRYFAEAAKADKRITASDFLGPYLEDLLTVLRGRGVELYNENVDALSGTQPVIDDILAQQKYEEGRKKPKTYEALRHDVTLWHLVTARRPARLDAPLEAVYWIATADYRFVAFDLFKRRNNGVPVCLHPSTLVQMLQLWLPRTQRFDDALIEGLRTALPHSFDSESEQMTIKILGALARYENVDDLPAVAVSAILVNQALRSRMRDVSEFEKQAELVRDEIVRAAAEAQEALAREKRRVEQLEAEVGKAKEAAALTEAKLIAADSERAKERAEALRRQEEERAASAALQQRVEAIEAERLRERAAWTREASALATKTVRQRFAVVAVFLALALVVLGRYLLLGAYVTWPLKGKVALGFVLAGIWCGFALIGALRLPAVGSWVVLRWIKWLSGVIFGVIGLGLLVNATWEAIR